MPPPEQLREWILLVVASGYTLLFGGAAIGVLLALILSLVFGVAGIVRLFVMLLSGAKHDRSEEWLELVCIMLGAVVSLLLFLTSTTLLLILFNLRV